MPNVHGLFATPFYSDYIHGASEYVDIVSSLEFKRPNDDTGFVSVNTYVLELDELAKLKQDIQNHVNNYAYNICGLSNAYDFYITNSWVMKHGEGDKAGRHYHSNCMFSGILYLKCEPNSGEITFHKNWFIPTVVPQMLELDVDEYNAFNADSYTIVPEQNQIILFPSHLEHSVAKCRSQQERLCLPFNVFLKGELGHHNEVQTSRIDFK